MKKTNLLLCLLFLPFLANAQYYLNWASQGISFDVPDVFIVNEDTKESLDADAEFYTIEASAKELSQEATNFEDNIQEAVKDLAKNRGLRDVLLGGEINLSQGRAFYARATEKIGESLKETPVLVLLVIDSKKQKALEFFIYCHDGSETTGMKIVQQIHYTPK